MHDLILGFDVTVPTTIVGLMGPLIVVLALGWAVSKTTALTAWRSTAEGLEAQNRELTARLDMAVNDAAALSTKFSELEAELEKRPDMSQAIEATEVNAARGAAEIVKAMHELLRPVTESLEEALRLLRGRP